jgi:hypothetical protein
MIEDRSFDPWESGLCAECPSAYQVEFWSTPGGPGSMWHADVTRLLEAASIEEVLAWARERAEGRDIAIWAEVARGRDRGRVLLIGVDPPRAD